MIFLKGQLLLFGDTCLQFQSSGRLMKMVINLRSPWALLKVSVQTTLDQHTVLRNRLKGYSRCNKASLVFKIYALSELEVGHTGQS